MFYSGNSFLLGKYVWAAVFYANFSVHASPPSLFRMHMRTSKTMHPRVTA